MQIGYSGKLPAFGDFVEGGGAYDARRGWKDWVERGLNLAKSEVEGNFADIFLTAPLWRFAVAERVFGAQAAFGVCCPSMDKVGRLFPFVVIGELPRGVRPMTALTALGDWFERTETVVIEALDPHYRLDALLGSLPEAPQITASSYAPPPSGAGTAFRRMVLADDGMPSPMEDGALDLQADTMDDPDGVWISMRETPEDSLAFSQFGPVSDALYTILITREVP